ncbi:MAG: membrane protein insertase YidC [Planctomycetota bacterium]|nr:MAG: membrane protein insertase YidC [Planctomycetota bacterium]REK21395.1 MAG: membrane protein insertase YidC [Planctomycetota bacterium]REK40094.1 MAG: membrane protein insertase YidC [Planctomycetota bacterium]
MEQRRFILFIASSALFMLLWMRFGPKPVVPPPGPANNAAGQQAEEPAEDEKADPADPAVVADAADEEPTPPADDEAADQPPPADLKLPEFPRRTVTLGSDERDSDYFLQVELTTTGAAIVSATLSDERYITADGKREPLKVVGNNPDTTLKTLAVEVEKIEEALPGDLTLADVDWEIVDKSDTSVTFRYPDPAGRFEIRKHFEIQPGDPENPDGDTAGYLVRFDVEFVNLTNETQTLNYRLQGPVGVPLENADNTRTFTEIKVGTVEDPGDPVQLTAKTLVGQVEDKIQNNDPAAVDTWREPLKYIGVDVQYFAALLFPRDEQAKDHDGDGAPDPYFKESTPQLVHQAQEPEQSDISVTMRSRDLILAPGGSEQHEFELFLGPKRSELLQPLDAGGVITFGWFTPISIGMVYMLNFFHHAFGLPYALAIVVLTLIVRACMFPITRKQAAGAKKMKELQPKLQEIKAKYAKEPEKFWKAQRELFRKHNYSPMAGCLPLFLQLPIFIGLYNALNYDVDLRMVEFLWIDNLAAPDAIFSFGFEVPFLHWTDFNLLPVITIVLWVIQQKLFMPPATSPEQELQYKMMSWMMIVVGLMIYRVPAGLCVYFITSTMWGITERKILDWKKDDEPSSQPQAAIVESTVSKTSDEPEQPKRQGFFAKLIEAADQARAEAARNGRNGNAANSQNSARGATERNSPNSGKKRSRKKGRSRHR